MLHGVLVMLVTSLGWGRGRQFVVITSFGGINTPTQANFKLTLIMELRRDAHNQLFVN